MDIKELFIKTNQALNDVVQQVAPDKLQVVMPDYAAYQPGQLLERHLQICAHENACVPRMLKAEVGIPNNQEFSEDYLKDDYKGNFAKLTQIANDAVLQATDEDLAQTVHMSYADAKAQDYLRDIVIQRAMATIDIAQAIGVKPSWPAEVLQGIWDATQPFAATLREYGVFPAEVSVPEDAPLEDRLIGLMGRQP